MTLNKRIKKLEMVMSARSALWPQLICIEPLSADPNENGKSELRRITYGGYEWLREVGEQQEEFIERALQAAQQQHPDRRVVCLGIAEL